MVHHQSRATVPAAIRKGLAVSTEPSEEVCFHVISTGVLTTGFALKIAEKSKAAGIASAGP